MSIQRFDHAAINCKDIAKSKAFYGEILGLKPGKSADMGACILHYMELGDGSAVELFELKDRAAYDSLSRQEGFLKHIAFTVDNIQEMNARLQQEGVPFEMELCTLEPLGVLALLCKDPDGVIVELSQKI